MSSSGNTDTVYIKVAQNIRVMDRRVRMEDVAEVECANEGMLRQIRQMKLYMFPSKDGKEKLPKMMQEVFSVLKLVELIHEEYPEADVQNAGEMDFIVEYLPYGEPKKASEIIKTILVCIVIFFGSAFTIMAFNNDISITDLFSKFYKQVTGETSTGVSSLEISYCIGLGIGILLFFNHVGKKKIMQDPTPMQVEMRKYEKDIDTAFIENAGRGGRSHEVR